MKLKILFIVYDPCPLNYRTMEGYYGTKVFFQEFCYYSHKLKNGFGNKKYEVDQILYCLTLDDLKNDK